MPETVGDRYQRLLRGGNTERMAFFSDAVFAIALTLLVIDIKVPDDHSGSAGAVILDQVPSFLAYALSFTIIALNWAGHHRKFKVIQRNDGKLMTINFVLLFLVAFVPFPTSLISTYGSEVPGVVLYASVVGLLSAVQGLMWWSARRAGLMDAQVDTGVYRYVASSVMVTPVIFWLSIPLALIFDGQVAMYSWLLMIPGNILVGRWNARRLAEPA